MLHLGERQVVIPMERIFDVQCPLCGKHSEIVSCASVPQLSCGDCLLDRTEVVKMIAAVQKYSCLPPTAPSVNRDTAQHIDHSNCAQTSLGSRR
jgi:hypothetical protein